MRKNNINTIKILMFVSLIAVFVVVLISLYSIFSFKNDIDRLFNNRTLPSVILENMKDYYKINILETLKQYKNKEINYTQAKEVIGLAQIVLNKQWKTYLNHSIDKDKIDYLLLENIYLLRKDINKQINDFLQKKPYNYSNIKDLIYSINMFISDLINQNLKKALSEKNKTDKRFSVMIKISALSIIIIIIGSIVLLIFLIEHFKKINLILEKEVKKKTEELEKINKNLEFKIKKAVEENRKKDKIMFQQAKLAAMGEMLQNIAHQWRQPLASLSMIIEGFQIKSQFGKLDNDYIQRKTEEAIKIAENMSKTIDDFKNFFLPDKSKKIVNIKECIEHSKKLLLPVLNKYNVDLIVKIRHNVNIFGYPNELSHVCLNIVNNAIEQLKNKEGLKRIAIFVKTDKKNVIISIVDNGGGINEEIIDKIFEPYFTTKLKEHGSGIGLYMAKQIIEKHMQGVIRVKNIKHKMFGEKLYNCAMFEVILPLKEEK